MLRLRDVFLPSLTTRCITNTEPVKKKKKRSIKASHLSSDTAGKTEEVTMTTDLFYRSCSGRFSRKTLARISSHIQTHKHTELYLHTEDLQW